ncbi:MAG: hypothetical protein AB7F86_19720 [Bdellovibrionales bacterium]
MNKRDLWNFLALEALAIAVAGGAFALISSKVVAGLVAGSYFIGFALFILWRISHWNLFGSSLREWPVLILPLLVHLLAVSVPMLVVRLMNLDQEFSTLTIWGLPAQQFHKLSTQVFSALMVATVVDLVRVNFRRVKP